MSIKLKKIFNIIKSVFFFKFFELKISNKIKNRNNKDPYKIILCATKLDLINDDNKKNLEDIQNKFKDFKLYKLSKDSGEDIKKVYDEFIER